jgi:hypothetical protein
MILRSNPGSGAAVEITVRGVAVDLKMTLNIPSDKPGPLV